MINLPNIFDRNCSLRTLEMEFQSIEISKFFGGACPHTPYWLTPSAFDHFISILIYPGFSCLKGWTVCMTVSTLRIHCQPRKILPASLSEKLFAVCLHQLCHVFSSRWLSFKLFLEDFATQHNMEIIEFCVKIKSIVARPPVYCRELSIYKSYETLQNGDQSRET